MQLLKNKSTEPHKKPLRGKLTKKRVLLFCAIAIVLVIGAAVGIRMLGTDESSTAQMEYTTATVERRNIETTLTGSGSLEPADSYTVTSLVEGEILNDTFEEGNEVEDGTLLYEIDSDDTTTTIEKAQLNYDSALKSYQRKLESLEDLTVTATISGTVTELNVEVGDEVNSGTQLATLRNDRTMVLTLPFNTYDTDQMSVGMTAQVTLDSSFETITGTVTKISGATTVLSGNQIVRQVTIEVKNPGAIAPGDTATAVVSNMACNQSGSFAYKDEATVTAAVSGTVSAIYVDEGDYLSKGQTMIVLESDTLQDAVESSENTLNDAQLSLENAQETLDNYNITSPIAGTVIDKAYKAGDNVTSGKTLCTIYDLSYLTVTLSVDELDVQEVEVGQEVTITADAAEGQTYSGVVTKVSVSGTTSGGVTAYPVTIRIDETEGLLPGMNVDCTIMVSASENTLTIPISAISRGNTVLVQRDEGAAEKLGMVTDEVPTGFEQVTVTLGQSDEDYIEILSGLEEGDVVAYTVGLVSDEVSGNVDESGFSFNENRAGNSDRTYSGGNMPSGGGPSGGSAPGGGF